MNLLFTSSQGISLHKFAVIDILYLISFTKIWMKDKVSKFVSVLNGSNLKRESTAVVSVSCCDRAQLSSNSR